MTEDQLLAIMSAILFAGDMARRAGAGAVVTDHDEKGTFYRLQKVDPPLSNSFVVNWARGILGEVRK